MLFGYDNLVSEFTRLVDGRKLFHAYLLFGEPETGKFLFAHSLARYQEEGVCEKPVRALQETLVISSEESEGEGIGIESIRELSAFLYRTPQHSPYRFVIIRDAEALTPEAQNALLKILEEPPIHGVIFAVAKDPDALLATLRSRFAKIFFPILPLDRVLDFLGGYGKISKERRNEIAHYSQGRIGRALVISEEKAASQKVRQETKKILDLLIGGNVSYDALADDIVAVSQKTPSFLDIFLEELLLLLGERNDDVSGAARNAVCETIRLFHTLLVNKRIHIKTLLWTIKLSLRPSSLSQ